MATTDLAPPGRGAFRTLRSPTSGGVMLRLFGRVVGSAMFFAALLVWIAPGYEWGAEVMLLKVAISSVAMLAGAGLLQLSAHDNLPMVEIDPKASEIRQVRKDVFGSRVMIRTCAFQDIEKVEHDGSHLRIWGPGGFELVDTELADFEAVHTVVKKLRIYGKLD